MDTFGIQRVGYSGEGNWKSFQHIDPELKTPPEKPTSPFETPPKLPSKRNWSCLSNQESIAKTRTSLALQSLEHGLAHLYHSIPEIESLEPDDLSTLKRTQIMTTHALWVRSKEFRNYLRNDSVVRSTYLSQGATFAHDLTRHFESNLSIEDRVKYRDHFRQAIKELLNLDKKLSS